MAGYDAITRYNRITPSIKYEMVMVISRSAGPEKASVAITGNNKMPSILLAIYTIKM